MIHHEYDASLSEYVDGTLQASEGPEDVARLEAIEAHLASCARCLALVEDLHSVHNAARDLPPVVPPAHLWSRIAGEIGHPKRSLFSTLATAGWRPLAAAAAIALLVFGASWLAWHRVVPATVATVPASQPSPDPELIQDVETELKLAEEHYVKAIAGLEAIATADGAELDAQTAAVMQSNLTVIDTAIGQSREALQTEPASTVAQDSLFEALRSKVTLLQDTIALINEMRKGNQQGTARIVSELNP